MENQSEIARIRALIDAEYRSGCLAVHGLAQGTAQHIFMTRRTENISRYIRELDEKYGEQVAIQIMMEMGEGPIETAGKQSVMNKDEKRFYTLNEAMQHLNITLEVLVKKINLYNIEIRTLPGRTSEYLSAEDVAVIERSIEQPGYPG